MNAVILRTRPSIAMLPIAGRPLIARQIQWMRCLGVTQVVVEIAADADGAAIARWLSGHDPVGTAVTLIPCGAPVSARELAGRAGLSPSEPVLVVPGDVVGGGAASLSTPALSLPAPTALGPDHEAVLLEVLWPRASEEPAPDRPGRPWACRIQSGVDALALSTAILRAHAGGSVDAELTSVLLHAQERLPGVWIARGAQVDARAELVAPVLVGSDAVVRAFARVGPNAFIGDGTVIERGAVVASAVVKEETIVGEGVSIESCVADPGGLMDLSDQRWFPVADPLLLSRRPRSPLFSLARLAAFILLVLSAPAALIFGASIGQPWLDILVGRRAWVGRGSLPANLCRRAASGLVEAATRAPEGVFVIDGALCPNTSDPSLILRAYAAYAVTKSLRVDVQLMWTAARLRAATRGSPARSVAWVKLRSSGLALLLALSMLACIGALSDGQPADETRQRSALK